MPRPSYSTAIWASSHCSFRSTQRARFSLTGLPLQAARAVESRPGGHTAPRFRVTMPGTRRRGSWWPAATEWSRMEGNDS